MVDIFLDFLLIRECEFFFPSPLLEESLQCPNVRKKDANVTKGIAPTFLLLVPEAFIDQSISSVGKARLVYQNRNLG